MRVLPIWAKKPKSRKEVIATSKGWVVKETGEVLASYKGLDEKLKELYAEIEELSVVDIEPTKTEAPEAVEKDEEPAPEQNQDQQEKSEDQTVSEVVKPKTPVRRGRPKKNAAKR